MTRNLAAVLAHQVRFDRNGYPACARSLPLDLMVDIIAVADTYDAITTLRVYQAPVPPRAALTQLEKLAGTMLDRELVRRFVALIGKYPVGTLVRLDTNEVGVVYRPNPLDEEAPLVRLLFDAKGGFLDQPREVPLQRHNGCRYAEIVAVVDPLLKNIDVGRYVMAGGCPAAAC